MEGIYSNHSIGNCPPSAFTIFRVYSDRSLCRVRKKSLALDDKNVHTVALFGHFCLLIRQHAKDIPKGKRFIALHIALKTTIRN